MKGAWFIGSADDRFSVAVNGVTCGGSGNEGEAWRIVRRIDIAPALKTDQNTVTVEAENLPAPAANPAGLIGTIVVKMEDGARVEAPTDSQWEASKQQDGRWEKAGVVADYGGGPWGRIGEGNRDPLFGPQATGIVGNMRVIYVPDAQTVALHGLTKERLYEASWFDPVTGKTTDLPAISADRAGEAICPAPQGLGHDWVLTLRDPR